MDAKRAQEIVKSNETIRVMYGDDSVWIDTVDPQNGTATVHHVYDRDEEIDVPVQELEER